MTTPFIKKIMTKFDEQKKSLSLYQCKINNSDIKKIIEIGLQIKILGLSDNNITSQGIRQLIKGNFIHLEELYLSWNKIGIQGAKFLGSNTKPWKKLKKIWLAQNNIGAQGVKDLAKSDWKFLFQLNLGCNQIGNEGVQYLAEGQWKNLQKLWISENKIGCQSMIYLIRGNWIKLTHISIWNNDIKDEGARLLLKADWKNLQFINMLKNNVEQCQKNYLIDKLTNLNKNIDIDI